MTDSELLENYINNRDENAFTEIVVRYERLVWSVCHRLLMNQSDREDAFQETFLVLARGAHRIKNPDSISNWLYGVTWRTASRIRRRRTYLSLDEHIERGNEIAASGEAQLQRIARLNEFELVNRTLQSMPEVHRTPLILFYFSGFTAKQIADQLNLTLAAAEGRLRRAREKLRRLTSTRTFATGNAPKKFSPTRGSVLLLLADTIDFQSRPDLVASTVENSIAATASVSTGVTIGLLGTGTKLMIFKLACAVGISALLALGGSHQIGFIQENDNSPIAQLVLPQAESDIESTAPLILSRVEPAACLLAKVSACCDGERCVVFEAIHSHIQAADCCIAQHALKLCELVRCCEPDESVEQ